MRKRRQIDKQARERGAALLIAIFALLLISVVAIALIVSSGTDTALASNFRSYTNAYYAALAGMEEARGRLLNTNGNCIPVPPNAVPPNTVCNPLSALPMPLTQVVYIINPLGGETVAPWNTSNPSTYPDTEYIKEFGVDVSTRIVTAYASVSPVGSYPGPSYKWVRINPVTEKSLGGGTNVGGTLGVDVNADGFIDQFTPLFYDPDNPNGSGGVAPGLIVNPNPPATAGQALEITTYAVLPSGTQKMLQYVVRPSVIFPYFNSNNPNLNAPLFPAALTLAGNNVTFTGPQTSSFFIKGQDQCTGSNLAMPAIGYTNNSGGDTSLANITAGATPAGNYLGAPMNPGPPQTPATAPTSIGYVGNLLNPNWLTPSGLDAIVQDITNSADVVIQGNATGASLPSGMSAANPLTIVVNGNLNLTSWHNTGYGLLVVTGVLTYDPDASWQGVVLVIGQGSFVSTKGGLGGINGAVFIAKTRDASNNELPTLGAASYSQTGSGGSLGSGINFSSCVAQSAEGPIDYKIISFKEIPLS